MTVFLCAGCRGVYRAHNLPSELTARPAINIQSLDLSKIGVSEFRNDVIYPSDIVEVRAVTGDRNLQTWEVRVGEDGVAGVPLVGPVRIGGMNVQGAANEIRELSIRREIFVDPSIDVRISKRRVNRITVAGAVNNPRIIELPTVNSNLAAALYEAGGLSKDAQGDVEITNPAHGAASNGGPDVVEQRDASSSVLTEFQGPGELKTDVGELRPLKESPRKVRVDLVSAVASRTGNYNLDDGAIVMVHKKPRRVVHVMGLSGNRSIELPPDYDLRLLDALSQAGGLRYSDWILDRVNVIRRVPGSDESATINLSIGKAKRDGVENIILAAGDVVSVEENALTFTMGTVQKLMGVGITAAQSASYFPIP